MVQTFTMPLPIFGLQSSLCLIWLSTFPFTPQISHLYVQGARSSRKSVGTAHGLLQQTKGSSLVFLCWHFEEKIGTRTRQTSICSGFVSHFLHSLPRTSSDVSCRSHLRQ